MMAEKRIIKKPASADATLFHWCGSAANRSRRTDTYSLLHSRTGPSGNAGSSFQLIEQQFASAVISQFANQSRAVINALSNV